MGEVGNGEREAGECKESITRSQIKKKLRYWDLVIYLIEKSLGIMTSGINGQ